MAKDYQPDHSARQCLSPDRDGLSSERQQIILESLELVERVSSQLQTTSYLWGGMACDVYEGHFLRDHHDLDYLVVDLHPRIGEFVRCFEGAGYTPTVLTNGDLKIEGAGIGVHLGHIEVYNQEARNHKVGNQAQWIHNRNSERGVLCFPALWLNSNPCSLLDINVHVVAPELEFVLKRYPQLLNPQWKRRPKDEIALELTTSILQDQGVETEQLSSFVSVGSPITN